MINGLEASRPVSGKDCVWTRATQFMPDTFQMDLFWRSSKELTKTIQEIKKKTISLNPDKMK